MFVNRQATNIADAARYSEEEFELLNSILCHINEEFNARSKAAKRGHAIDSYHKLLDQHTQNEEEKFCKQSSLEPSYEGLADVSKLDPSLFNGFASNDPCLENHPFKNELIYFAYLIAETRCFLNEMSVEYQICIN